MGALRLSTLSGDSESSLIALDAMPELDPNEITVLVVEFTVELLLVDVSDLLLLGSLTAAGIGGDRTL